MGMRKSACEELSTVKNMDVTDTSMTTSMSGTASVVASFTLLENEEIIAISDTMMSTADSMTRNRLTY